MAKILDILYLHQDKKYGDFTAKLIPTLQREYFIGVRSPEYKKILKEIDSDKDATEELKTFLNTLPHKFYEENILHSILVCKIKDFDECILQLEAFLPYINNWSVSDGVSIKSIAKNKDKLILKIKEWLCSDLTYTKRVAMILLKKYFLKEDFKKEYLEWVAELRSEEYYVNMMIAWLFADALVFQWDCAISFIQNKKLAPWTHNKAIQKARESFRITDEQKEYLKSLKV